ncbi:MAG: hypothetical protein Q9227_005281 [Pyrenula ochraceoflavens]
MAAKVRFQHRAPSILTSDSLATCLQRLRLDSSLSMPFLCPYNPAFSPPQHQSRRSITHIATQRFQKRRPSYYATTFPLLTRPADKPKAFPLAKRRHPFVGTVIKAGTMDKCVVVRTPTQVYNKMLMKYLRAKAQYLCHDPRNSLRVGDVIEYAEWEERGTRGNRVEMVVERILSPFGEPIDQREKVPDRAEREIMWRERVERIKGFREQAEGEKKPPAGAEKKIDKRKGQGLRMEAVVQDIKADELQRQLDKEGVGEEEVRRRDKQGQNAPM